ncbi:haloalkane dehalogenase [bacterium SCSIO 12741]|nr:haloalkane dehalogenase [bacterium SCSIO 12741]
MKKTEIGENFPFESKFLEVKGSRMHYIDEGQGNPILFIHGNPTSSYIWRNIIPYVTEDSRAIAVDLIGFGKSDKPAIDYGFTDSYAYLEAFIEKLGLKDIILVVQDWGSGLGFHYANTHRENIRGIAFMEAMYEQKDWNKLTPSLKMAFTMIQSKPLSWLMLGVGNQFIKKMLPDGIVRKLSPQEMETYAAPFKTLKSRKPSYVFPRDVPIKNKPAHTAEAVNNYNYWLQETPIPKLMFYADPGMLIPIEEVPWIEKNFPNLTSIKLGKGIHFVQEDHPHTIGAGLKKWIKSLVQSKL